MASGGRDEMIKPLSQDDPCPQHPAKMLEVFCEKCFRLICFLCSNGDHKGHPTSLASERAGSMLEELRADERELAKLKNKWSGEVTNVKGRQDQITKAYQQTLKDLKKKYEADMVEAEKGLPDVKKEDKDIEALQQEIKKLDSSSSLATMAHLKPQVDAALGQKLPTRAASKDSRGDVRERVRRLIPGDITKPDSSNAYFTTPPPRVMSRSYHVECFNYASGKTDIFPGAFKEPDVTTSICLHDMTLIKAGDAAALCAIVGGQPSLTREEYREYSDEDCLVHDDGTVVSCLARITDNKDAVPRDKAGRAGSHGCYLPVSATVGDALQCHLGWRPASVVNYLDKEPVDKKMTVKIWRDSFPGDMLKIKK